MLLYLVGKTGEGQRDVYQEFNFSHLFEMPSKWICWAAVRNSEESFQLEM